MKTIRQKAKAYDEAIDKVAHFIKKHIGAGCIIHPNSSEAKELFNIFPELAESEDERIRKELLEHCKNQAKPYIQTGNKCPQIQSWIAWLEKQGEQKSTDNLTQQEAMDIAVAKCFDEQNPAWSKEDEKTLNTTISFLSEYAAKGYENAIMCIDWIKALKQRVEE